MHRMALTLGLGALVAALALAQGEPPEPDPPVYAVVLNLNGVLDTCGCSASQLGGVARWQPALRRACPELAEGAVVPVVLLGATYGDPWRAQLVHDSARAAGARLAIASDPDAYLAALSEEVRAEVASVGALTEGPWRAEALGLDVALLDDLPPAESARALADRPRDATPLLLLTREPEALATTLHSCPPSRRPEVVALLTGEGPATVGEMAGVPLLSGGSRGRALFLVRRGAEGASVEVVALTENVPNDPAVVEVYAPHLAEEARAFHEAPRVEASAGKLGFALPSACAGCHPDEYEDWLESAHAGALRTLEEKERTIPECLPCHSDPYAALGERLATDAPSDETVGCHHCHGPGMVHIALDGKGTIRRTPAEEHCLVCHTEEQSAEFEFEAYLDATDHIE